MPREEVPVDTSKYELLPTQKPHVSFSEMREWKECSYRHKLHHVLKIDLDKPGPLMDFGTACHASCEDYLKTRVMKPEIAVRMLTDLFETNKAHDGYEPKALTKHIEEINAILGELPPWLEETFPGWEYVDAEHLLYEPIEGTPHAFKGYIDAIIKVKNKGKKGETIWLIDWKSSSWGWNAYKRSDVMIKAQLVLYKNFWAKKMNVDPKQVKTGFVLLKRTVKPNQHCELITTSVGDVSTERALKVVTNMVATVKRGIAIKDRSSCKYCPYRDTEHCT